MVLMRGVYYNGRFILYCVEDIQDRRLQHALMTSSTAWHLSRKEITS